jgi:TonB family protein
VPMNVRSEHDACREAKNIAHLRRLVCFMAAAFVAVHPCEAAAQDAVATQLYGKVLGRETVLVQTRNDSIFVAAMLGDRIASALVPLPQASFRAWVDSTRVVLDAPVTVHLTAVQSIHRRGPSAASMMQDAYTASIKDAQAVDTVERLPDGYDLYVSRLIDGVRGDYYVLDVKDNEDEERVDLTPAQYRVFMAAVILGTRSVTPAMARPAAAPSTAVTDPTYFEFQVEKRAEPMSDNPAPAYPASLSKHRIEGEVLAQFAVDTSGYADMSTLKVLKSSQDAFTDEVKRALPKMRFKPAEMGGHKVKQLVQESFAFGGA